MRGRRWTQAELATLRLLWPVILTRQIANLLDRTCSSVLNQACILGLRRARRNWTTTEEETLRREYPRRGSICTALLLDRTPAQIIRRAHELGVRRRALKQQAAA